MRKVLPEIDYKKAVTTLRFKKAEVVFVKYITEQEILNDIVKMREDHCVSPFAFTTLEQFKSWRSIYPNQSDLGGLYKSIKSLLQKHQLPGHFNLAMLDYVLFGFRINLFFDGAQQKKFLCVLAEDVQLPLAEYAGSRSFRSIIVFDGATEKDIINSIRGRFRTKVTSRAASPGKHNRDVMLRYYKHKTIAELRSILDEYQMEYVKQHTKAGLIKKIVKRKFDTTVSEATVNKVRLEA